MPILSDDIQAVKAPRASVNAADTYARPAIQDGGGDQLAELGNALSKFGLTVSNSANDQTARNAKAQDEAQQIDYYVSQVRSQRQKDKSLESEVVRLLPQQNPITRARVAEQLGVEQGREWVQNEAGVRLANPAFLTNPEAFQAEAAKLKEEARVKFGGQPFYGAGFAKSTDDYIDRALSAKTAADIKVFTEYEFKRYQGEIGDATDKANSGFVGNSIKTFVDTIVKPGSAEGTGKNPYSSASGVGQFIESTWLSMIKQYGNQIGVDTRTMNDGQLLALRKDPVVGKFITTKYAEQNVAYLQSKGVSNISPGAIYAAHYFGPAVAADFLKADPNAKATDVLPRSTVFNAEGKAINPNLVGKTVGQVMAMLERQASDGKKVPTTPLEAMQDAVRGVDSQYKMSSLNNALRNSALQDLFVTQALAKKDTSYLDRIPPEWQNPAMQVKLNEVRGQIANMQMADYTRARQLENDQRQEETRQAKSNIIREAVSGTLNPATYAGDPEAFDYATKMVSAPFMREDVSRQQAANFSDAFENASITGNWDGLRKAFGMEGTGQMSPAEIRDAIMKTPNLRPQEAGALMDKVDQMVDVANKLSDPGVKANYDTYVGSYVQSLTSGPMGQIQQYNGIDLQSMAKQMYNANYMRALKLKSQDGPVTGEKLYQMEKEVGQTTREAIERIVKASSPGGDKPDSPKTAQAKNTAKQLTESPGFADPKSGEETILMGLSSRPGFVPVSNRAGAPREMKISDLPTEVRTQVIKALVEQGRPDLVFEPTVNKDAERERTAEPPKPKATPAPTTKKQPRGGGPAN